MENYKPCTSKPCKMQLHNSRNTVPSTAAGRKDWKVSIKTDQKKNTFLHVAMVKICTITIPWRRSNCRDTARQILA